MFRYLMIITEEKDDNMAYYADHPEAGLFRNIIMGNSADKLMKGEYEGMFYQLYDMNSRERIGYGILDYQSLKDNIEFAN